MFEDANYGFFIYSTDNEHPVTEQLIPQLVIYMVVLLLAISAHEAAHAWMSNRFGDDTARLLGRVTLNPVAHIDPIGTLLIPIVGLCSAARADRTFRS